MTRRLVLVISALILILAAVGTVMAGSSHDLESACAPDATTYGWILRFSTAGDHPMEFSWQSDFDSPWRMTLAGEGVQTLMTVRGGSTLYVRFLDEPGASDSAAASTELCG